MLSYDNENKRRFLMKVKKIGIYKWKFKVADLLLRKNEYRNKQNIYFFITININFNGYSI